MKKLIIESVDEGLCKDMSLKLCACQVMLGLLRDIIKYEEKNRINISANDSAAAQIYKAIRNIHKNYTEEIDAGKYAKMVGMSYSYFSRCFKRITGRSFKEYVNEVRINHAEQLLLTTEQSVTQISLECGYNNASYFITVYKRLKGGTPYANKKHSRE